MADEIGMKNLASVQEKQADGEKTYNLPEKYLGTPDDKVDMKVLGRQQELRRNFGLVTMTGFAATLQNAWEFLLLSSFFCLFNGGYAGTIYGFILAAAGYIFIYLSLAEMASMIPTAGGQFHWVSELAPPKWQKFLSYMTGWFCLTSWQVGMAAGSFGVGTAIQGLLVLNLPDYVFERWHGTLLSIAIITVAIAINIFGSKKLPFIEGIMVSVHIFGFFAIVLPLWLLAPRQQSSVVWTQFFNGGGWSSNGVSLFVGMLTSTNSISFGDSIVHMAEETRDASWVLPRAMITAVISSIVQGFIILVTLCYTLGDLEYVIFTPTGYPFIQVFFDATNSLTATNIMTALVLVNVTSATGSFVATTSRQTWAFARDKGLPFSTFLRKVQPSMNLPLNAMLLSWWTTVLLSLINIGSTTAFNSIVSLGVAAILASYLISIGCLVRCRIINAPMPKGRWTLGRYGMPVNICALCFCSVLLVFNFFPPSPELTAQTMNYNIVMFVGVFVFAASYYFIHARHIYSAPVALVKRDY